MCGSSCHLTPDKRFDHLQGAKCDLHAHCVLNKSPFLKIFFVDVCGCCLELGWNVYANENRNFGICSEGSDRLHIIAA